MPTEEDRPRSGTNTAEVNTGAPPNTMAANAYGTTQKCGVGKSGDGRSGVPIVAGMALGSTLSSPLGGLPVSANIFTSCTVT